MGAQFSKPFEVGTVNIYISRYSQLLTDCLLKVGVGNGYHLTIVYC